MWDYTWFIIDLIYQKTKSPYTHMDAPLISQCGTMHGSLQTQYIKKRKTPYIHMDTSSFSQCGIIHSLLQTIYKKNTKTKKVETIHIQLVEG